MTTKTREEVAGEMDVQILKDIKAGHILSNYRIGEDFIEYTMNVNGKHRQAFTPAKPEFETGTIGLDEDSDICFYNTLNNMGNYLVCSSEKKLKGTCGYTVRTFTPIYQTDPVEKRAFEMACRETTSFLVDNDEMLNTIKNKFLSKAKEELSK